ncbi:hypothetical protein ENKNEFLB_00768 [Nocardioides aquaticus]|uniref:Uncharacterized protein n=1 Tax=Nocardioides aquaticus TaxID=160826 RepID=A0ABX8EFH4_9ACTN|nr:hypothetical protein [Nocardioides aquaticus]QVT78391.1 hypothetical protein ENKNEFLB_00768 [Nocardioides aquaticus]
MPGAPREPDDNSTHHPDPDSDATPDDDGEDDLDRHDVPMLGGAGPILAILAMALLALLAVQLSGTR